MHMLEACHRVGLCWLQWRQLELVAVSGRADERRMELIAAQRSSSLFLVPPADSCSQPVLSSSLPVGSRIALARSALLAR